jgi:hypothetical protein
MHDKVDGPGCRRGLGVHHGRRDGLFSLKKNDKSENRFSRLRAVFYFVTEKSSEPTNTTSCPSITLNLIPFLCIAIMLGWKQSKLFCV